MALAVQGAAAKASPALGGVQAAFAATATGWHVSRPQCSCTAALIGRAVTGHRVAVVGNLLVVSTTHAQAARIGTVAGQSRLALAAVYTISRTASVTGRSALTLAASHQSDDGGALDLIDISPPRLAWTGAPVRLTRRETGPPGLDWSAGPPHVGRH
jgi:hypothetical protein